MIVLSPAVYDKAEKLGVDMRPYTRAENVPIADTRPRRITYADIMRNGNRRARRDAMRRMKKGL